MLSSMTRIVTLSSGERELERFAEVSSRARATTYCSP
jgi:hypothetical protein